MPDSESSVLEQILATGGAEAGGFLQVMSDPRLEKLLVTSELPPPAVIPFSILMLVADRFSSPVLKNWAKRFLQAQVIKDRKRAAELVELFQVIRSKAEEE